jgi:hypothetical protein
VQSTQLRVEGRRLEGVFPIMVIVFQEVV